MGAWSMGRRFTPNLPSLCAFRMAQLSCAGSNMHKEEPICPNELETSLPPPLNGRTLDTRAVLYIVRRPAFLERKWGESTTKAITHLARRRDSGVSRRVHTAHGLAH